MKDWTCNNKSTYVMLGASNHSDKDRQIDDYYATDPHSLEIFLEKLKIDGIKLHNNIWECACGAGHLSDVLIKNGHHVYSSDLVDRGYGEYGKDFLKSDGISNCDILTNPPYKYAKEFVSHALDILDDEYYCVMFLKIQFLESQSRLQLFKKYPPKFIYVNSERQLCSMNGDFDKYNARAICYCWFVWQKGYTGEPIIRWI